MADWLSPSPSPSSLSDLKLSAGSHSEDPLEYFNREVQKRRDEEANLWSTPGDPSHSEREDDRVLYSLLQARNKTRMGSTVTWKQQKSDRVPVI